jgi:hypothetical protein
MYVRNRAPWLFLMKLLITSVSAALALFAATVLPSPTGSRNRAVVPVTMSSQDLQSAVDVKKLPAEDFEDQSLVYSTKR